MDKTTKKIVKLPFAWLSLIFSALIFLIALSFPTFFFITPNKTNSLLAIIQVFYIIGWVSLVAVPPTLLFIFRDVNKAVRLLLMVAVLIFPASAIADHVALIVLEGNPYLEYLIKYPILLVANLIIPTIYVIILARLAPRAAEPELISKPLSADSTPPWRMPDTWDESK